MAVAQEVNATVTYFAYLKNLNKTIGYAINAKLTITKRTVDSFNVALICAVLLGSSRFSGKVAYAYNAEKQNA